MKKGMCALYLFCLKKNGNDRDMIFAKSRQTLNISPLSSGSCVPLLSTRLEKRKEYVGTSRLFIQFKMDFRSYHSALKHLQNYGI